MYSDGSTQDLTRSATWSSSQTAIASVSNVGVVTGATAGQSTISASMPGANGGGAIASGTVVTVSDAVVKSVTISPNAVLFATGSTQQ